MADEIRVIAFKEGDFWVAQCLEHDICAQAPDLDALRSRMEIAIASEAPLHNLPKAPEHFFKMWERKSDFNKSGTSDGVGYEMALCA
jgi:hypothetical protein